VSADETSLTADLYCSAASRHSSGPALAAVETEKHAAKNQWADLRMVSPFQTGALRQGTWGAMMAVVNTRFFAAAVEVSSRPVDAPSPLQVVPVKLCICDDCLPRLSPVDRLRAPHLRAAEQTGAHLNCERGQPALILQFSPGHFAL